jgi:HK97 gp10 family phage protein
MWKVIQVKLSGVTELVGALNKVNETFKSEIMRIILDAMQKTVDAARTETEARGWALADTIRIGFIDEENLMVEGVVSSPYAGFPEFGTVNQRAQPYWMPFVWVNFNEMMIKLSDLQRRLLQ